jgi:hypothetical protein
MKIYLSNLNLIYFLFPEAKIIKEFGCVVYDELVLYELQKGESIFDIEKQVKTLFTSYILVTHVLSHAVDITLNNRIDYIAYIATKKNIKRVKDVDTKIEKLSGYDFEKFLKMSLILGRWYKEIFVYKEKIYKLYEAIFQSTKDLIKIYVELNRRMSEEEIFSSILTFLLRLKNRDNQKNNFSDYYKNLTKVGSNQNMRINDKLIGLVNLSKLIPLENRLLEFYLSLK